MALILVIEDEPDLVLGLRRNLEAEGFRVLHALDGAHGLELAIKETPDCVILDWMLPKLDGLEVCRRLRAAGRRVPVLMLTARGQEVVKVVGLEVGADDYVVKPFGVRELVARVKALLRRATGGVVRAEKLQVGAWEIDCARFEARRGAESRSLSRYEVELLALLARRPGEAVGRQEILNQVWGMDASPTDRTIDNYVVKLRRTLEEDPKRPRYLLTVHGIGYKLVP
ncbi:MAG: response regulator transcription factor [Planctomycetes bacterium]|nr:response regulator transcription factor [Planctomycetota bacterium]